MRKSISIGGARVMLPVVDERVLNNCAVRRRFNDSVNERAWELEVFD